MIRLEPAVRQKLDARAEAGCVREDAGAVRRAAQAHFSNMADAPCRGIALDYDGTLVDIDATGRPPSEDMLLALLRLAESGVALAVATGRGGSVGRMLRAALPKGLHRLVTVGYFNGSIIVPLSREIDDESLPPCPDVLEAARWLEAERLLRPGAQPKDRRVQLTIHFEKLKDPLSFARSVQHCPAVSAGRLRLVSSHHSYDLVPRQVSKARVAEALCAMSAGPILRIGDSGTRTGNDYELLSNPYGISVGSVCDSLSGTWSAFGTSLTGPCAVLRILESLEVRSEGVLLDVRRLAGGD